MGGSQSRLQVKNTMSKNAGKEGSVEEGLEDEGAMIKTRVSRFCEYEESHGLGASQQDVLTSKFSIVMNALRLTSWQRLCALPRQPGVRDSLLVGIASGVCVSGLSTFLPMMFPRVKVMESHSYKFGWISRGISRKMFPLHAFVITFTLTATIHHSIVQYYRARERAMARRMVQIIQSKTAGSTKEKHNTTTST